MALDADDQTPITVTVVPAFADYIRLHLRFIFRSPVILFIGLFPLTLGLCMPLMPNIEARPNGLAYLLPALISPALFFVIVPLATYFQVRWRWRTTVELREPRTYKFTDAGIQIDGETFNGFVAWSHIVAAQRMGGLAALSTGQQVFYLIPVKAFEGGAWGRFCRLVEEKVEAARLS